MGCQSGAVESPLGKRVELKGKVALASASLKGALISIFPVDPNKGDEQTAQIDAQNQFVLAAFPGKYLIAIEPGNTKGNTVPMNYRKAETSKLEVEVPAVGKSDLIIELKN